VPPHDLDAEAAVLSAVMIDERALDKVIDLLKAEHFYAEAHRQIYAAACDLRSSGQPVDIVQVGTWLKSRERIAQVGGMGYLTEVLNAAPAVANVRAYAVTIEKKARVRELIATCQRIAAQGYVDYGDADAFIQDAASKVHAIACATFRSEPTALIDILQENFEELSAAAARGEEMTGTPTGFTRYDRMTAGLHDGDLTIIAARPGMGKTALVLDIASNVASVRVRDAAEAARSETVERGVVVFSLEMPRSQIGNRMVCSAGRVDLGKIRTPMHLAPSDWGRMTEGAKHLGALRIWIDDTPAISLVEIAAKIRRLQSMFDAVDPKTGKVRRRVALGILDYLQLMSGRGDERSREQEISMLSRGLKGLAKELRMPIIALAQLNRAPELRKDRRPVLSDLRESGAIEQDADNICFVYRDDYYNPDTAERNIAELIIAKQRNGPTGTAKVRFDREYTRFDNLAEGEWEERDPTGTND
jgi:replicative DNA helicase